jgi:hypothetical protein
VHRPPPLTSITEPGDIAGKGVAVDVGQRDLAAGPRASSGDNRWSSSDSVMTVTCDSDRQILLPNF